MPDTPDSLPLGPGVRLIGRHPSGLLAFDKPSGILSHPNPDQPEDLPRSLLTVPYDPSDEAYLLRDGSRVHLIHRLDSATSGVILLATQSETASRAREAFADREARKTYTALVFGVPRSRRETWNDSLQVTRSHGQLRTFSSRPGEGEHAACEMRLLRTFNGTPVVSLVELCPTTGRTHQLRVQCQKRRLPIVGDTTYGDFSKNRLFTQRTSWDRLMLHASAVSLQLPGKQHRETVEFCSPPPPVFQHPR